MKIYMYAIGDQKKGPFSLNGLKLEPIQYDTLIWYEGLAQWIPAHQVEELSSMFNMAPPPLPVQEVSKKSVNISRGRSGSSKNPSTGWIIAGFIFALLGGFLGLGIAANYFFGDYDYRTKKIGLVMGIISIVSIFLWKNA